MLRLIGLTIKGIILLALLIAGAQFITLSDETWTNIGAIMPSEDTFHIVVGGVVVILGLVIVCKVVAFVGPLVVGVCKVVFFPVIIPLKVLGWMFGGSSYSSPAPRPAPRPLHKPQATSRPSMVMTTAHEPMPLKPVPTAKPQHGYKLTYSNITAAKGSTQTVNFTFRGGPTECRIALESGELRGQGFVPSCMQIVNLEMTY